MRPSISSLRERFLRGLKMTLRLPRNSREAREKIWNWTACGEASSIGSINRIVVGLYVRPWMVLDGKRK